VEMGGEKAGGKGILTNLVTRSSATVVRPQRSLSLVSVSYININLLVPLGILSLLMLKRYSHYRVAFLKKGKGGKGKKRSDFCQNMMR